LLAIPALARFKTPPQEEPGTHDHHDLRIFKIGPRRGCRRIKIKRRRKSSDTFYVEDNGPGLGGTPEEIGALFSIRRPIRSSKLLRLPQRGALGNGLRVVAGAVLASEDSLTVVTRNRRIMLQPRADGHTEVVKVAAADRPNGTRIEIGFGPAPPPDPAGAPLAASVGPKSA
jgi:hypothetical protein